MSRGLGKLQRKILKSLKSIKSAKDWLPYRRGGKPRRWPRCLLVGRTKSKTTAMRRAGVALAKAGKVILIKLWNENYPDGIGRVCTYAFHAKIAGQPGVLEFLDGLSVDLVSHPNGTTYEGSIRNCAMSANTPLATFWRNTRKVKKNENHKS